jgi:tRNA threonylcarbamoyladenosine biosynthesis protein TsaE
LDIKQYRANSLSQLDVLANQILEAVSGYKYILFNGTLGAGKTTLIAEMLKLLGVPDLITSPTFTLSNVYRARNGKKYLHSDLYRIHSVAELEMTGFFEYLSLSDKAFVEWADAGLKNLLVNYAEIDITIQSDFRKYMLNFSADSR